MKTNLKTILGRATLLDFPELSLTSVPAKTDTGAYRSAVHAEDIKLVTENGKKLLKFNLLKGHSSAPAGASCEASEFRIVEIENSFGQSEERYEVKLLCVINGKRVRTGFTLANRGKKKYPILIGRRLINNRFLVDTTISQIDRRILKEQFHVVLPNDEEDI